MLPQELKVSRTKILIIGVITLFGCGSVEPNKVQESNLESTALLDEYIEAMAANKRFNGSVLITKKDTIVFKKSLGLTSVEGNEGFTDSSIFLIGSITKTFTAAAILQLVEQNKLSLSDKLNHFFPDFPRSEEVTIQQLLTHYSGIRDYHEFENWKWESRRKSLVPKDVIETVKRDAFHYEPGERFYYTNTGYVFLGLIIEQVSGLSFAEYIDQQICKPLELTSTGVCVNEIGPQKLVKGYRTSPREKAVAEYINLNQPFSSGNMYSNLHDLRRFTKAVFSAELFSKELVQQLKFMNSGTYGFGWGIRAYDSLRLYGHLGAMNGFVGAVNYLPEQDLFIGFLTNDDNTPRSQLSNDLTTWALGKPITIPPKKKYRNFNPLERTQYVGDYLIKPGDSLSVFVEDELLFIKETGQEKHELFCFETHYFDTEKLEFDIEFSGEVNGVFDTLKFLKSNRSFLKAPRILY